MPPPTGRFASILLCLPLIVLAVLGFVTLQVFTVTTPPRLISVLDFESMLIEVESVRFLSADGLELSGWWMPGAREMPPVLLCHDFGGSKSELINVAIALHEVGFPLLLMDFRGHGESEGTRSTLGIKEKRDVLGAIDWLRDPTGRNYSRIGIYGAGMGAHAAVLAAADRREVRVMALDGLYPDAAFPLTSGVFGDWHAGAEHLAWLPRAVFATLYGTRIDRHRAAAAIAGLEGRDLLLLAPAGDSVLAAEMERMHAAIPEHPDVDGNLVVLPATHGHGLRGEDFTRYHEWVCDFFRERLVRADPVRLREAS